MLRRTLYFICILFVVVQILQVDTRVRHNEELLGPLRSIEAPQDEFGRAARRGRIDILGLILKKRIAHLRRAGQAELVFLVDSSASVGSDNFYNEIKFIRKVFYYFYYTVMVELNHQVALLSLCLMTSLYIILQGVPASFGLILSKKVEF